MMPSAASSSGSVSKGNWKAGSVALRITKLARGIPATSLAASYCFRRGSDTTLFHAFKCFWQGRRAGGGRKCDRQRLTGCPAELCYGNAENEQQASVDNNAHEELRDHCGKYKSRETADAFPAAA